MPEQPIPPGACVPVPARYFDGRSSRLHHVTLTVTDGVAHLRGDVERSDPLAALRVSERSRHAARKVSFDDGAYLEVDDTAGFEQLLRRTGHQDGLVVRLQQSWRAVLLSALAVVAALALAYAWLLPAAAGWIAAALPEQAERQLGNGVLRVLDQRLFLPTQLTTQRQRQLHDRFAALAPPDAGAPAWRLVFRRSRIGPNAFALPSGDIVLTDDMARLLQDDEAVMGVLAHELGHLHRRHMTRRIIQGSVVTAGAALVFGDMSSLLTTVPALLLDMKYSRDAEREADDYAIAMFKHNGIPLRHLVAVFERLEQQEGKAGGGQGMDYLSSHPANAERIARIRAGASRDR